ncbi:heme ABC exporter ATP-binding protein CcmA [Sphingomonas asaccharolytica]|uniref:heme ABC exporter ATP-binding protein CcmA n=1 Tax=Sphingomonas asaccharolytica TaxID=40681 RepID=UPI00082D9B5A|nr:heme ABC exporter ATP-binding protein CcmA [Sphingomonas asaccharolytica]
MTLIAFDAVTCVRGGRALFEGLSFALEQGGAALVTGPNGIGKSSLIRLAAGLLAPAAGCIIDDVPRALLTDQASLDEELPLARALAFWARLDGVAGDVAAALDALALSDLADIPVRLLSTGQRRRAAIARVIASGAPLWLLDEPANGLDKMALGLLETTIATHRASGGAVLVASHTPITLPDVIAIDLSQHLPLLERAI